MIGLPHLCVVWGFNRSQKCRNPCAVLSPPMNDKCDPVQIKGPKKKELDEKEREINQKEKRIAEKKRDQKKIGK
jgi:hypothetical protein